MFSSAVPQACAWRDLEAMPLVDGSDHRKLLQRPFRYFFITEMWITG
jgi:hypothetical protein